MQPIQLFESHERMDVEHDARAIIDAFRIHSEDDLRAMGACAEDYRWDYAETPCARCCRAVVLSGILLERC